MARNTLVSNRCYCLKTFVRNTDSQDAEGGTLEEFTQNVAPVSTKWDIQL